MVIRGFWVISIVIDSDRGHSYKHFKKKSIYDENWKHDMNLNVCICDEFLSSQKWQKIKFLNFQAQPVWVMVISSSILYVNVVREISMIKIVILDQSKPYC